MDKKFEEMMSRLSPTLRRITHKLNGHFSFFDDSDLFQEALSHLWVAFNRGGLDDKTDSYILQGCFFHLKNYLRKALDRAKITSLDQLIGEDGYDIEETLASDDDESCEREIDADLLMDLAKASGLDNRELKILSLLLDGLTMREIGLRMGISHVMVLKIKRKIRKKAIKWLPKPSYFYLYNCG